LEAKELGVRLEANKTDAGHKAQGQRRKDEYVRLEADKTGARRRKKHSDHVLEGRFKSQSAQTASG